MYDWRNMTEKQRAEVLRHRLLLRRPLHAPPHFDEPGHHRYHLAAANYEHATILGKEPERMKEFCQSLCTVLTEAGAELHAWCVLPNHWHALVGTESLNALLIHIAQLHGRTSFIWNQQDRLRGRQCWYRCADRRVRSEPHFYAVRNYIHHNPIRHGYVKQWEEWPYSSAADYLRDVGQDIAKSLWHKYPVLDMGKGWDDF